MRRRDFLALLGSMAAAGSLRAEAQTPAMPVIGFLNSASPGPAATLVAAFRHGLNKAGYVEGKMSRLSTVGPRVNTIGCGGWPPIWFAATSP